MKLSTRITLYYAIFSALLAAALMVVLYSGTANALKGTMKQQLEAAIADTKYRLVTGNHESYDDHDSDHENDYIDDDLTEDEGISLVVLREDGTVFAATDNGMWLADLAQDDDEIETKYRSRNWYVLQDDLDTEHASYTIRAAATTVYRNEALKDMAQSMAVIGPIYLLIGILGAWLLSRRSLRPVRQITATAGEIAEDTDLSARIPPMPVKDEVGELGDTFNKMMDKLETSFQRERQFTSDASHELRTPVTIISASAEDALREEVPETVGDDLKTIQKESSRMGKIISQLLVLSRGYEGRLHYEPEEMDLHDMAASVAELYGGMAAESGMTIHNEIPEQSLAYVDQSLFTEVFLNLIGNAVKYGRKGGNVWARARKEGDTWEIHIVDDGPGISPEDLPHIFERFYRADKARDRSGSGLGLSITKWIVEMHGGKISAQSKLGEETEFIITGVPTPKPTA